MAKTNHRIEIVRSNIRGLSSMSQISCDGIFAVLDKYYSGVKVTVIEDILDLEALVARKPDLVFLGMEFIPADPLLHLDDPLKIWIAQYLDEGNITYTGSGPKAHQFGRDKSLAKQRVLDAGLSTSPFYVIRRDQPSTQAANPELTFPLFIKPVNRGGGFGIDSNSVVHNANQVNAKVHSITVNLRSDSLVEEYLQGREFSVAVLKEEDSPEYSVMPLELVAPADTHGARILSGKVKSSNSEQVIEVTDSIIKSKVNELALRTFKALGARDYGRIDIRLDQHGVPHFLEANLIPSLISGYGSFPKACVLNANLDFESMILRITNLGLARRATSGTNIHELTPLVTRTVTPAVGALELV